MRPELIVAEEILLKILLRIPKWIRMRFFNAERWVASDFHFDEPKTVVPERKEYWGAHPNYPFNRITIRIPWDNRSKHCDVELKELFLRVFVNKAPFKVIVWNEKERRVGIKPLSHLEREIDTYNADNFIFRRNTKGLLDVYIYLPPYIDTEQEVRVELLGYAVFSSPFEEFIKKISCEVRVDPEDWKS